jgi:hypothetical protein
VSNLRKIATSLAVIVVSALTLLLVYPLLGLFGYGFYFLLPGFYLARILPSSWVNPSEPGPTAGVFVVFAISFLVWWLVLSAIACACLLLRNRSAGGA